MEIGKTRKIKQKYEGKFYLEDLCQNIAKQMRHANLEFPFLKHKVPVNTCYCSLWTLVKGNNREVLHKVLDASYIKHFSTNRNFSFYARRQLMAIVVTSDSPCEVKHELIIQAISDLQKRRISTCAGMTV